MALPRDMWRAVLRSTAAAAEGGRLLSSLDRRAVACASRLLRAVVDVEEARAIELETRLRRVALLADGYDLEYPHDIVTIDVTPDVRVEVRRDDLRRDRYRYTFTLLGPAALECDAIKRAIDAAPPPLDMSRPVKPARRPWSDSEDDDADDDHPLQASRRGVKRKSHAEVLLLLRHFVKVPRQPIDYGEPAPESLVLRSYLQAALRLVPMALDTDRLTATRLVIERLCRRW